MASAQAVKPLKKVAKKKAVKKAQLFEFQSRETKEAYNKRRALRRRQLRAEAKLKAAVAPPLTDAGEQAAAEEPKIGSLKVEVAVNTADLEKLEGLAVRLAESASVIASGRDEHQKQLHRRVQISVYDKDGTRISNGEHDLAVDDEFTFSVNSDGEGGIKAVTTAAAR